jgi:LmbE family N-acetylglucosaminyl deacetylase
MNPITQKHRNVASVTAHGDDLEMHNSGALETAINPLAVVFSDGEASTLNYSGLQFAGLEDYKQQRRRESEAALGQLGIGPNQRKYLGLPDGKLDREPHRTIMVEELGVFAIEHNVTAFLTLGARGHCGHSDHVQAHNAAINTQTYLWDTRGWALDVYALANPEDIEEETDRELVHVPVVQRRKEHLLGYHTTQMARTVTDNGRHVLLPRFRESLLPVYGSLFKEEVYERFTVASKRRLQVTSRYK